MAGSSSSAQACWSRRNEDSISTCSETSHTIINMPEDGRRYLDENTPIRFSNPGGCPIPAKQSMTRKVAFSAGALILFVIVGGVFAAVYSSFGPKDGVKRNDISYQHVYIEHNSAAAALTDTEDLGPAKLEEAQPQVELPAVDSPSRGSTPLKASSGNVFIPVRENPSIPVSQTVKREESRARPAPVAVTTEAQPISSSPQGRDNNDDNDNTATKAKKKEDDGIEHFKRTLPVNATLKTPVGLLYEMKLIPSSQKINCVTRFTKCEHVFDGKKIYKGWKAVIPVNATIAGIGEDQNTFIGYGKDTKRAKLMAAQYAIMTIYPGSVTYTVDPNDEASEIKQFCEGKEEEVNKECNRQ